MSDILKFCYRFCVLCCCLQISFNFSFTYASYQVFSMKPTCERGQFLNETTDHCFRCPDGSFNSVAGRNTECAPCRKDCFSRHAEMVYQCNATHNLYCKCEDGYVLGNSGHCTRPIMQLPTGSGKDFYDTTSQLPLSRNTTIPLANASSTSNTTSISTGTYYTKVTLIPLAIGFALAMVGISIVILWHYNQQNRKTEQAKRQNSNSSIESGFLECQGRVPQEKGPLLSWPAMDQNGTLDDMENTGDTAHHNSERATENGSAAHRVSASSDIFSATTVPLDNSLQCELPSSSLCSYLNLREDD